VVLLSAPNDIRNSEWQECLELGVNDFICKTTPPEIVKRKLDSILEGESYRKLSEELKEKLSFEESRSPIEELDFRAISALIPDAREWAYTFRIIQ
jgi:Response regulator containing a CheY-like receiver domain and an HD-GYP domain